MRSPAQQPPSTPPSPTSAAPGVTWLMRALLLWGGVLAAGAAFHRPFDARRAVLVMGCVLTYLAVWIVLLKRAQRTRRAEPKTRARIADERALPGPSWTCWISFHLATLTALLLVVTEADWITQIGSRTLDRPAVYPWIALSAPAAIVLSMIGLSDPRPRSGKRAAVLGLLLALGALTYCLFSP